MDSVVMFRAVDFPDAFQHALSLGKAREEEYLNGDGERVRWRLTEIISIDQMPRANLDGVEVYSEPVELPIGAIIPFTAQFTPEVSRPTQTV
jgi:hypothetical protein